MFEDRLDLGREKEQAVLVVPVERLDAVLVAGEEEALSRAVPNGECKHAIKPRDAIGPPFLIGVNDDFRVRWRVETVTFRLQLDAELLEVVKLAVVNDDDRPVLVGHRLVAEWRKIDDREAAMAEPDRPVGVLAERV